MKVNQGKEFFISVGGGYTDGTMDYNEFKFDVFDNEAEALDKAKSDTEEYSETNYVFRCTPIYRVRYGKIRVDKLKG